GGDAFFAWNPDEPLVRVSPDVYLLREPVPRPLPHSWQTWLSGHCPPEVAFEIVSDDWKKDYELGPAKYALLGVGELLIFDPGVVQGTATGEERFALQLYRRTEDGLFVLRYAGDGPVHSRVLECHVVALQTPGGPRLRLAADPEGRELQPSVAEAREAAKRDREAAIREREAAERKAEALQMELDRLREKEESR
ncbi:MAG: Uma2 family endonuclease, partial [Planctomycetes bacterium]|nr:Uma2 family endonuclease [Planctomycetota bacterium]